MLLLLFKYVVYFLVTGMASICECDQPHDDIGHPKVVYKSRQVELKGYVLLSIFMCVNLYIYKVNVDY